ncbi:MAG: hypothetical protein M3Z25_07020 [Actinomycetota bacterium]|nr:hypothetical protein [Actinomycetota bacterium]
MSTTAANGEQRIGWTTATPWPGYGAVTTPYRALRRGEQLFPMRVLRRGEQLFPMRVLRSSPS